MKSSLGRRSTTFSQALSSFSWSKPKILCGEFCHLNVIATNTLTEIVVGPTSSTLIDKGCCKGLNWFPQAVLLINNWQTSSSQTKTRHCRFILHTPAPRKSCGLHPKNLHFHSSYVHTTSPAQQKREGERGRRSISDQLLSSARALSHERLIGPPFPVGMNRTGDRNGAWNRLIIDESPMIEMLCFRWKRNLMRTEMRYWMGFWLWGIRFAPTPGLAVNSNLISEPGKVRSPLIWLLLHIRFFGVSKGPQLAKEVTKFRGNPIKHSKYDVKEAGSVGAQLYFSFSFCNCLSKWDLLFREKIHVNVLKGANHDKFQAGVLRPDKSAWSVYNNHHHNNANIRSCLQVTSQEQKGAQTTTRTTQAWNKISRVNHHSHTWSLKTLS